MLSEMVDSPLVGREMGLWLKMDEWTALSYSFSLFVALLPFLSFWGATLVMLRADPGFALKTRS